MAVGIQAASTPQADRMGSATVSEHFPKPEISLIAAARGKRLEASINVSSSNEIS